VQRFNQFSNTKRIINKLKTFTTNHTALSNPALRAHSPIYRLAVLQPPDAHSTMQLHGRNRPCCVVKQFSFSIIT